MPNSSKTLVKRFALTLLACTPGAVKAEISINIDAATLQISSGVPATDNSLVLLVASTSDSLFANPTPTQFASGDDIVLGSWSLGSGFDPGTFAKILALSNEELSTRPALNLGDPLRLYWYPTLTTASTEPGAGTKYGTYRSDAPPEGNPWTFPADGVSSYPLVFLTESAGGTLSDSLGEASFSVIPEPSTYAVIFAIGCLGLGFVRKLRPQRA